MCSHRAPHVGFRQSGALHQECSTSTDTARSGWAAAAKRKGRSWHPAHRGSRAGGQSTSCNIIRPTSPGSGPRRCRVRCAANRAHMWKQRRAPIDRDDFSRGQSGIVQMKAAFGGEITLSEGKPGSTSFIPPPLPQTNRKCQVQYPPPPLAPSVK